jgi:ATP-dependent helicase Lhr and Lhr-like helicase
MTKNNLQPIHFWFDIQGWKPQSFQKQTWDFYQNGHSGLINAPTGSGKTYSILLPAMLKNPQPSGLTIIWITPIRALAKEIHQAAVRAAEGLNLSWNIAIRTGDTSATDRAKQRKKAPNLLITTPESLHLILAQKKYPQWLDGLHTIVVDEWHELIGSKRGVQMELALSRLKGLIPSLQVWGISATIGNLQQAMRVLCGEKRKLVKANIHKHIEVESIVPDEIEVLPWAGHLGTKLIPKVLPIIHQSKSTLLFTNTRAQAEIWYQQLLDADPSLAGKMAMHHGSISKEIRGWVEDALYQGQIAVVVCTSSLDLGVDFRPVDTIIQVGSPKGVSRFVQRAGRSGHRPGATSTIYFVPTHSLELVEAAALRQAVKEGIREDRVPPRLCYDVLIQYLVTLAVSDGFFPGEIFQEIKQTECFRGLDEANFQRCLHFITTGGESFREYEEFRRVEIEADGRYVVKRRKTAMRHRLSIGTIVSDAMLRVKFVRGGHIGSIEEWFVSRLKPGDNFWFGGRSLELVRIKDLEVQVKISNKKKGAIPSWMGGRMPLSGKLGAVLRDHVHAVANGELFDELELLLPLWEVQHERSSLPREGELLMEKFHTKEGYHLCCFPFEGRHIHEGLAAMLAHHLAAKDGQSFSIAMNDYGFELLSDQEIRIEEALEVKVWEIMNVDDDLEEGLNSGEMAKRAFRDIAAISGMVFQGYPGKQIKDRHLLASSSLIYSVLEEYEPDHFLLQQARREVMEITMEKARMEEVLQRIRNLNVVLSYPEKVTPLSFPIMVDRLRERMSTETLEQRIRKMQMT